jgi:acyl phosphate:glycerol-3-phosphate acyltransferase
VIDERTIAWAALGAVYAAVGYLLGSIPVAWLLTWQLTGRDLRTMGSGNVGVMNTALSVNRWAGLVVLLTEVAKGLLAVLVPWFATGEPVVIGACALGAFVGTRWPVWLRFHGGRGNTCAAASLVLIAPAAVLVLAIVFFTLRWMGLGNFAATRLMVAALPPVVGLTTLSWWWLAVGVAYVVLFLTTHRPTTDDHLLIEQQFPSLWAFITSPRRHRNDEEVSEGQPPVAGDAV